MSLHKAIRELAGNMENSELAKEHPEYKDLLFDVADTLIEILDRYPLETGHEWEPATVYLTDTPEVRDVCKLCGMDRLWGDEASTCDNRRPETDKPTDVDDK